MKGIARNRLSFFYFLINLLTIINFSFSPAGLSAAGVALAIIGKLVITGAFAITYSATADVFPTAIR